MKAIVTGGAGFIGSHLVEKLLEDGEEVVCLDNFSRGELSNLDAAKMSKNFEIIQGDLSSKEFAKINIREADIVYHLAAANGTQLFYEKPRYVIENNISTTENVLEAANENGIKKVIFASSSEVYGYPGEFPTPETAKLVFDSPDVVRWSYAISKLCDEHLCFAYNKEFGLETTCLRLFNTYGPRLSGTYYGQVVSIFIRRVLAGMTIEIYGDGEQTRSFCYVDDTVQGFVKSSRITSKKTQIFNIGNEDELSINELARMILAICKKDSPEVKIEHLPSMPGDSLRRCPSLTQARNILGYEPKVSLDKGLQFTVDWFRSIKN